MNLIPYKNKKQLSPFRLIEDLHSDLSNIFGETLPSINSLESNSHWLPHTDIHDTGNELIFKIDIPGMNKKDIEVNIEGKTLIIRGEKKLEDEMQDKGFLRSERFFGYFERALALTDDVDSNKIKAEYKDGVLSLTIAKKEEAKPKQIKVEVK